MIHTTINLPTLPPRPSHNSIQSSTDGQLALLTKSAVYILTPDHGISFDTRSWFKTMIEFNKQSYDWTRLSQDWAAISLGSLDLILRAAACSPTSGLIATLSTNMDLSLWTAPKNHLKGEWLKIQDVTRDLITSCEHQSPTATALYAQIICIAWSSQPDFGVEPTPVSDASLFIAGNRAGSILFMRYSHPKSGRLRMTGDKTALKVVHTLTVADKWITHIALSSWTLTRLGTCEAYLAYGLSDGFIGLVKITQALIQPSSHAQTFEPEFSVQAGFEIGGCASHADQRGITALTWVQVPGKDRILVHCKPGAVYLWSPSPSTTLGWSGHRVLFLQTQKLSVGSCALHPVSGIQYIDRRDALIVCLFDGSCHVIHDLSLEPTWATTGGDEVTTERLSAVLRSIFNQVEQEDMQYADVNKISGMLSYDGSATFMWLHEAVRPTDFSYKHDAQHHSTFVVARLWDDPGEDQAVLRAFAEIVDAAPIGQVPIHTLRPTLFYLRREGALSRVHSRVLDILRHRPSPPLDFFSTQFEVGGEVTEELRSGLRRSLWRHLFGWRYVRSLRLRLAVADFGWQNCSDDQQKQAEYGEVAQDILNMISYSVLWTIVQHIRRIVKLISVKDVPFIARIITRSVRPGAPPELAREAGCLLAEMKSVVPVEGDADERCPVCRVDIPLGDDMTNATCSNGHTWARCSITSFVLATPMVRTCLGCTRKAFLPVPREDEDGDRGTRRGSWLSIGEDDGGISWVVEDVVDAVNVCLFCGNRFVNIL